MTFWRGQTLKKIKRPVVVGVGREEGRIGEAQSIFRALKILCMVLQ